MHICLYVYMYCHARVTAKQKANMYVCVSVYIFICIHVYVHIFICIYAYGVATISRLRKIISLCCRISSLVQGSFAKETYHFKEPTN